MSILIEYVEKNSKGFSLQDITKDNLFWEYIVLIKEKKVSLQINRGKGYLEINLGGKTIKYIPGKESVNLSGDIGSIIALRSFLQKFLESQKWKVKEIAKESNIQEVPELKLKEKRWKNLRIYILCGLPGSGKTTYIKNKQKEQEIERSPRYSHSQDGDVFIDLEKKEVLWYSEWYLTSKTDYKDLTLESASMKKLLDNIHSRTYSHKPCSIYIDGIVITQKKDAKRIGKLFEEAFFIHFIGFYNIEQTEEENRNIYLQNLKSRDEKNTTLFATVKQQPLELQSFVDTWVHIIPISREQNILLRFLNLDNETNFIYGNSYRSWEGRTRDLYDWWTENMDGYEADDSDKYYFSELYELDGITDVNYISWIKENGEEIEDSSYIDPYWDGNYYRIKFDKVELINWLLEEDSEIIQRIEKKILENIKEEQYSKEFEEGLLSLFKG